MCEHGTKATPVFLPAHGEAGKFGSVPLLSGATVQPENTYSHILKMTGQCCYYFDRTKAVAWK